MDISQVSSLPPGALRNNSADSCEIMGPAGTLVQIMMGLFSFLVLTGKRAFESPKREWKVWALDTSKQAVSGGLIHILNVVSALLMTSNEQSSSTDSCAWYFITMLFDTTMGSMFNIAVLISLEKVFTRNNLDHLKSGNYFREINAPEADLEKEKIEGVQIKHVYIDIDYLAWTLQLGIWCTIVAMVKTVLFFIVNLLAEPLGAFGTNVLAVVNVHGFMRLAFVLVIVPIIANSIQFWITDNFLKKKVFTEKDLTAQTVYFRVTPRDAKHLPRSVSSVVRGQMGSSNALQISKVLSPKIERQEGRVRITRIYNPEEMKAAIEAGRRSEERRIKSF